MTSARVLAIRSASRAAGVNATLSVLIATVLAMSGVAPASAADTVAPANTIAITSPASGLVSGVLTVSVNVSGSPSSLSLSVDEASVMGGPVAPGATTDFALNTEIFSTGWHRLAVAACYVDGPCVASAPVSVYVSSLAPSITAPAAGTRLSGLARITVDPSTVQGLGVAFFISGNWVAYDEVAPYSVVVDLTGLSDGYHSLTVANCSSSTVCSVRRSEPVRVVTTALHPRIVRQVSSSFSPNGDGVLDSTRTAFSLPTPQAATWTATTSKGTVVRGPLRLGSLSAGQHSYTWDGKDNQGRKLPDARYTVVVRTRAGSLYGAVSAKVVIDTVAPIAAEVRGGGAVFYPYPDHYRDRVVLGFAVTSPPGSYESRAVTATVQISDRSGRLVRSFPSRLYSTTREATWDGRTAAGVRVPDGTYSWRITLRDQAGNTWTSQRYSVSVSSKKIVRKTLVVTVDAARAATQSPTEPCATSKPSGYGASGILLDNACDPVNGPQPLEVTYAVTLPSALSYGPATVQAYGRSDTGALTYAWLNVSKAGTDYNPTLAVPTTSSRWLDYGSLGYIPGNGTVALGFAVMAGSNGPHSVDLRYLRVTVPAVVLV